MATIAISGSGIHYEQAGSGESVVLVHGSASDYRTWAQQCSAISSRFRVTWYSRRYHVPNAEIQRGQEYTMPPQVSDLGHLIQGLGLAPSHVIGHSYGAFLALLLAIRQPHLVRTLVLVEPPAITLFVSTVPKPLQLVRLLLTRPRTATEIIKFGAVGLAPATRAFRNGDPRTGIERFGDAVLGKGGFARLPDERKRHVNENAANIEAEILGPGFEELRAVDVAGVQQPVLLIDGGGSIGLFRCINDRLEELLPNVERVVVPSAGHMVHQEQPSAFNSVVMAFLDQNRSAA